MTERTFGNCLAIIPARYGSKRFPGKMLAPILGKSLIQHTYENAQRSPILKSIVIATDDVRIYDHVNAFGGKVVMTSPDCVNGTERLAEAYRSNFMHEPIDMILNIQGDEPCIDPEAMAATLAALAESQDAQMATAVTKITCAEDALSPSIVKCVINSSHHAVYFSRALIPNNQSGTYCPAHTYYRHLGIYAYRPKFLLNYASFKSMPLQMAEDLEQLKVLELGHKIKVAIVDSHLAGVDVPEDIHKIERLLCRQNISL